MSNIKSPDDRLFWYRQRTIKYDEEIRRNLRERKRRDRMLGILCLFLLAFVIFIGFFGAP